MNYPNYAPQPQAPAYQQPMAVPVPGPPVSQAPAIVPMQMALGTFTAPPKVDYDSVRADELIGRPLIVVITKFIPDFVSTKYPDPKPVINADVVDLTTGRIYIGPMWGAGRLVDHLKQHAGTGVPLPIKIVELDGRANKYLSPEPLDGAELAYAQQWWGTYPTAIADTRAAKEASAVTAASAPAAPMPVQGMPAPAFQPPGLVGQPQQPPASQYAAQPQAYQQPPAPAQQPAPTYSAPPQQYGAGAPAQPQPAAPPYQQPVPAPPGVQGYQQPAPVAPAAPATQAAWQPTAEQVAQYMAQQNATAQGAAMNPQNPTQPNPQYAQPPMAAPQPAGMAVSPADIQAAMASFQPQG